MVPPRLGVEDDDVAEPSLGQLRAQPVRRAGEDRERAVVGRDDLLHAEQLGGLGRLEGPHRVEVADREHRRVRRVELADQGHVAEHARVAGDVDLEPVLERDNESGRLAHVDDRAVLLAEARRVVGVGHRHAQALGLGRSALVHPDAVLEALHLEVVDHLEHADDRLRLLLRREPEHVGGVVGVAVRQEHHVHRAGVGGRGLRVPGEPRVDEDALSSGRLEQPGCVAEPGQPCAVQGHAITLLRRRRAH